MFLKNKEKDDRIVERNSLQWLNRKKYIVKGVWKMDYKKAIIEIIEKIEEKKVLEFIYDILNSFKERWGI